MPPKKARQKNNVSEGTCLLCFTEEDARLGKLYTAESMSAHYFCLLFASGLMQNGDDDEGLVGFMPDDVKQEANRAIRLRCSFCKKGGATIGCVNPRCRVAFHFPCGLSNGVLNQFYDAFKSFCREHRPHQTVPSSDRLAFVGTAKSTCSICMCPVDARASETTLRTPCCRNSWFHRDCIQQQANSSGMHFFKCPLCNNKEVYQNEMLQFGIHIPDQDAAWETENSAYHDLLERHNTCNMEPCKCPKGPKYMCENSKKWDLVLCDFCGSQGTHLSCAGLHSNQDDWVCTECRAFTGGLKQPANKSKRGRPPKKKVSQKRRVTEDFTEKFSKDFLVKKMKLACEEKCSPTATSTNKKTTVSSSKKKCETPLKETAVEAASTPPPVKESCSSTIATPHKSPKCDIAGSPRSSVKSPSYTPTSMDTKTPATKGSVKSPSYTPTSMDTKTSATKRVRSCSVYLQKRQLDLNPALLKDTKNIGLELRQLMAEDIHTGKNLGSRLSEQYGESCVAPCRGQPRRRSEVLSSLRHRSSSSKQSDFSVAKYAPCLHENAPKWVKKLYEDDFITGRNLGRRLSEQFHSGRLLPPSASSSTAGLSKRAAAEPCAAAAGAPSPSPQSEQSESCVEPASSQASPPHPLLVSTATDHSPTSSELIMVGEERMEIARSRKSESEPRVDAAGFESIELIEISSGEESEEEEDCCLVDGPAVEAHSSHTQEWHSTVAESSEDSDTALTTQARTKYYPRCATADDQLLTPAAPSQLPGCGTETPEWANPVFSNTAALGSVSDSCSVGLPPGPDQPVCGSVSVSPVYPACSKTEPLPPPPAVSSTHTEPHDRSQLLYEQSCKWLDEISVCQLDLCAV